MAIRVVLDWSQYAKSYWDDVNDVWTTTEASSTDYADVFEAAGVALKLIAQRTDRTPGLIYVHDTTTDRKYRPVLRPGMTGFPPQLRR